MVYITASLSQDVLKVIDSIEEKPDYIVLDPPRDGINPKALEKIIRYNVPQMVYISCKPTSLARDLEVLQARGYEVKKVCCVDMFPSTFHVETVILLSKEKSTRRKCVWSFLWRTWICPGSRRVRPMSRLKRMCWSIPV